MKEHNINNRDFDLELVEIESIELIGEEPTIDIEVEGVHVFFANGILTHNSSLDHEIIQAGTIAESYAKIMIADFVLSLQRKVTDKLAGTGRWHIIKNRFGPDGLTYPSKLNMSNGQMNIYEESSPQGQTTKKDMQNGTELLRARLAQKYKEISPNDFG